MKNLPRGFNKRRKFCRGLPLHKPEGRLDAARRTSTQIQARRRRFAHKKKTFCMFAFYLKNHRFALRANHGRPLFSFAPSSNSLFSVLEGLRLVKHCAHHVRCFRALSKDTVRCYFVRILCLYTGGPEGCETGCEKDEVEGVGEQTWSN